MRVHLVAGCLFAFLGVAAGAFGTHALRERISTEMLDIWEIGVRYQIYHSLSLLLIGFLGEKTGLPAAWWAGVALMVGILLFSGSLYLLAWTGLRWLGAVTPLGGVAFLVGWLLLAWVVWSAK